MLGIWTEVLRVGAWTGLSVGAVAGLGALAFYVPAVRGPAIGLAIAIGCFYGGELHGNSVGRADVKAQWDAADAQAAAEREERDASIAKEIEAKYAPQIAAQEAEDGKVANGALAAIAGAACPLGSEPLKLRKHAR